MGDSFDLIVVGGGSGGVRAARLAAQQYGLRVALVEESQLGGTCVHRGCVPKKLLFYGARYATLVAESQRFGWQFARPEFQWQVLRDHIAEELARLGKVYADLLARAGVVVVPGRGRLAGPSQVVVGERVLNAGDILIATGSRPQLPTIPGAQLGWVSDQIFGLAQLPRRITIVGGGYVGCEFASVLSQLGCELRLVCRRDRILAGFDHEVGPRLAAILRARGVDILLGTEVLELTRHGNDLVLRTGGEVERELQADAVLFATGRVAALDDLGLECLRPLARAPGGFLAVDDHYRTSQPGLYAVGDVSGGPQLTPVAIRQAMIFLDRRYGSGTLPAWGDHTVPTAVFTRPNVGTCGFSEHAARKQFSQLRVYQTEYRPLKAALSGDMSREWIKLVVDAASERVIGFHMIGEDAGEITQGVAVAMASGARQEDFVRTLGIHPTSAEEIVTLPGQGVLSG